MNIRLDIIAFLKENKGTQFQYNNIHTIIGGNYNENYLVLQRLVRDRIVSKEHKGKNYYYFVK